MSVACRARNPDSCRVHGRGSMYEDLSKKRAEYYAAGNMDAYIETRHKMEWLIDNNQEALDFYKNNKNKTSPSPSPSNDLTLAERMEDKLFDTADRFDEIKERIGETISEGVDRITDHHESPIPAEIGGSTVAWSDLNPFKNPFKNGKLR